MTVIKKQPSQLSEATVNALKLKLGIIEMEEQYMGVQIPIDGSTAMTRTGNASWGAKPPFLSEIALVLLADNLTENEVLCTWANPIIPANAILNGTAGQAMVRLKKFYYREIFSADGTFIEYRFSNKPLYGYKLHEKFSYGAGRDEIYIGAYEASLDATNKLASVSGVAPLTSVTSAQFLAYALARGTQWYNYDFYSDHIIMMFFYAFYANLNSQLMLPGYTEHTWADSFKRMTGRSNVLTTMNGSVNSDAAGVDLDLEGGWLGTSRVIANRFLFIENIFGHIWKIQQGVAFDGRVGYPNSVWATPNPALFSSVTATILANYINLNVSLPAAVNENYIQNWQGLFLPKTHGGSSSTYVTDYFWSYLDDATRDFFRLVISGGNLTYSAQAGLASRYADFDLVFAYSSIGSRLCAAKI